MAKTPKAAPEAKPGTEPETNDATGDGDTTEAAGMTAEQAAAAVGVAPEQVLAFRDHITHVVVVTDDGRKLSTADAEV